MPVVSAHLDPLWAWTGYSQLVSKRQYTWLLVTYTKLHPDVQLLDSEMEIPLLQIEMAHN